MFVLEHLRAFGYMLENPLISLFCEYAAGAANEFERRELTALRSSSHIDTAFDREYLFLFTNQSTASEADSRMSLISAARENYQYPRSSPCTS